jgi:signal transduction histidine kinase/CheY-like chemotaxis protein
MILFRNPNNPIWDSLIQLRVSALYKVAWITGICGWMGLAWALWPMTEQAAARQQMRPICLLLLVIAAVSFYLTERDAILTALIQIAGAVLCIMSMVGIFQSMDAVHLFALPVIFASVLLGQRAVIVTSCAVAAFNLFVAPVWLGLHWTALVTSTAILCLIAIAVIISTRNLYTALWWALDGFETARRNQDVARERKAELEQAFKSLDIAAHNLRRLNYALSLAQARAEEARHLKQQFAQTISHELRTPLNLIVGFTEAMIQSPEYYGEALPPRYLRDLSIVYRNANHLQNLVNDVLDLARIEAAQMTLQIEHHLLSVFLEDVVSMAQSMAETHGLRFYAELEANLPDVWMDAIRIKQVLYNLLSNAVRFTETGSITLRVSRQPHTLLFEVIDTGIGIDAADMRRIFEPFCQLENPMRRRVGGAGLGLPISRQLVQMHGGQLEVSSESGKGSRFYFDIPIKTGETAIEGSEAQAANVRPLHMIEENILLVITRSPSAAALLSHYLEKYRTVVARDFEEAKAAIDRLVPQVIIIDTNEMNADVHRFAANGHLAQTVVIACPLPGETLLRQRLSASGYLVKPVSRESLWNTLGQLEEPVERVLVVDDDPDFVRMIERMLDTPLRRYKVDRAHSGGEALMMMRHNQPDLVLLDLQMPDGDGFEVIQQIRSVPHWRDIRVVVISAQDEIDTTNTLTGDLVATRLCGLSPFELIQWLQRLLAA